MKEVIEKMLKVEEEARSLQAAAEKKAVEISENARRQAARKSEALRSEAQAEAASRIEAAAKALADQRTTRLAELDQANTRYAEGIRKKQPAAVERIVKRIAEV